MLTNGNVTWKQLKVIIAILAPAIVAVVVGLGSMCMANRESCVENATRAEATKSQLDRIEDKVDALMLK